MHAALHAFWDIPQTYLAKLATELEVAAPAPTTRAQTATALLPNICPDLKPEQVLQVLESKPPPPGLEETMDLPFQDLADMLEEGDIKEAQASALTYLVIINLIYLTTINLSEDNVVCALI